MSYCNENYRVVSKYFRQNFSEKGTWSEISLTTIMRKRNICDEANTNIFVQILGTRTLGGTGGPAGKAPASRRAVRTRCSWSTTITTAAGASPASSRTTSANRGEYSDSPYSVHGNVTGQNGEGWHTVWPSHRLISTIDGQSPSSLLTVELTLHRCTGSITI